MSIEILDDPCLLRIFREINDKQTLIICSQVNRRWHSLIFPSTVPEKRYNLGKIKGLNTMKEIIALDGWEIVVAPYEIEPDFFTEHGRKMKQLYIPNMSLDDFKKYVKYLPRLERLHLSSYSGFSKPSERYDGPKLERLEILEICTRSEDWEPYRGLSLMDRCPYLKSAFHNIDGEDFFVDTQVKNYYLEDLVIMFSTEAVNWPTLKKILGKCPNLKHLAIRHSNDTDIEDENIPEMLELLPKVVLIDLRVSPGVTYISADYVDEYCKLHNRSISFYYTEEHEHDIRVDWPQLSTKKFKSSPGYSFMKYCFLKPFNELPRVMDPIFLLPLLEDDIRNSKTKPNVQEQNLDPDKEEDGSLDLGNLFD
uniref:F-box domain-containing protein n=1 Tax=Tetranychus urticae TaxID=32264 RepID=T1JT73_TETUR